MTSAATCTSFQAVGMVAAGSSESLRQILRVDMQLVMLSALCLLKQPNHWSQRSYLFLTDAGCCLLMSSRASLVMDIDSTMNSVANVDHGVIGESNRLL
jgi:hypothetical protein